MERLSRVPLTDIEVKNCRSVLVVATTALGDAILCTPLIRSLREQLPNAKIGFWVKEKFAPLFQHDPNLNVVLPYYGKYTHLPRTFDRLHTESFDLALVANANDPDIIPLIYWSGCQQIIRRPQRDTIYRFMVANPEMLHAVHSSGHAIERNLEFLSLLKLKGGRPETYVAIDRIEQEKAGRLLSSRKRWIGLHPGASIAKKSWPIEHYKELQREMSQTHPDLGWVVTGSGVEVDGCGRLAAEIGALDLSGKLSLPELAAVQEKVAVFISGDTGPYHLAMAVGAPTVTLFAPWDAGSAVSINGPFFNRHKHKAIEAPDREQGIRSIQPRDVAALVRSLIT
jgi:ADP-heptose:LPS heptosyltransferase